jgi:protein-tyrosine phosphatase
MSRDVVHPFASLSNFRDVGGHATVDGRRMKTGAVFRSDALTRFTHHDIAKLRQFGIKTICDLRSITEHSKRPRSLDIVNIPLAEIEPGRKQLLGFLFGRVGGERFRAFSRRYYQHIAFEQTARVREILELLAQDGKLPALIHCTSGKDRTGFVAAVLQLLAGVPYATVEADYLRTNDYFAARLATFIRVVRAATLYRVREDRLRLVLMAHAEYLGEVHARIVAEHGTIEGYLHERCGLAQETLLRLKQNLLLDGGGSAP